MASAKVGSAKMSCQCFTERMGSDLKIELSTPVRIFAIL
jgi:hypothetical protein